MTLNGKVDGFVRADLLKLGARVGLRQDGAAVLEQVLAAVREWPKYAEKSGVPDSRRDAIQALHRLEALR
jgi:hypothetical protein